MKQENFFKEWIRYGALCSQGKGTLLIGWGGRTWTKEPSSFLPNFYFPDFFLKNPTPWFQHEHSQEISIQDLISVCSKHPFPKVQKCEWKNHERDFFYEAFSKLKKLIESNEMIKGVPFVMESSENTMEEGQLPASLKAVLNYAMHHPAYPYGFWGENEGMLGATPEILFKDEGQGILETMACAGTLNIKDNPQKFLSDQKELHEHQLVIKGIEESFSAYGRVITGELQLLKFSQLMHLMTPLRIQLDTELPFRKIIETIHPTPAVGAFPRAKGSQWLCEYEEKIQRCRFGAPAGLYSAKTRQSHCYVAIRNVQWKNEKMSIAAGCGIVADSQCDREWNEIQLKIQMIKEMLAL